MATNSTIVLTKQKVFLGMTMVSMVAALFTLFWLVHARNWLYVGEQLAAILAFILEIWFLTSLHTQALRRHPDDPAIALLTNRLVTLASIVFLLTTLPFLSVVAGQSHATYDKAVTQIHQVVARIG